jgi:hypothetical protein
MYNKVNNISEENYEPKYPTRKNWMLCSQVLPETKKPISTLSCCALPYISFMWTKFHGIDPEKSKELEWFLPRQKQSYVDWIPY